jgi:hypothetical protein
MTERDFEALVGKVVKQHLPKEAVAFDLGAREIVADLYARRGSRPSPRPEFGFGYDEIKTAVEFVGLLKGTFEVVQLVAGWWKTRAVKRDEVAAEWAARLVAQGLPAEMATTIAKQHAAELAAAVKG